MMMQDDLANDPKWKAVRFACFKRDNYTCCKCLVPKKPIECHHIKKKSVYPQLKYLLSNLITLCKDCHKDVTGNEERYEDEFKRLIEQKKLMMTAKKNSNRNKTAQKRAEAQHKWRPNNPRLRY